MLHKAIPPSVAALLKEIHLLPLPKKTYMAGGTALAIYLDHRVSVDIDLFTSEGFFCGPIISAIKKNHKIIVESAAERDTLIAEVDGVRLSLFRYPYPLLEPLSPNPDYDILLASPIDIGAMKVIAIVQRYGKRFCRSEGNYIILITFPWNILWLRFKKNMEFLRIIGIRLKRV